MKRIAPLLLLLAIVGTVIAKTITSGESSSLAKARQLLLDVAKAYQDAPALTDDILIEITEPNGSTSIPLSLALEGKKEGFFSYQDWKFYAFNDTLLITRDSFPDKYIRHDLEDSFIKTLLNNTGGSFLVPHLDLLNGNSLEDYVKGFGIGQMKDIRLAGLDIIDQGKGKISKLIFESSQGKVFAFVDNDTRLLTSVEAEFGSTKVVMTMKPTIQASLDKPITLDLTGRKVVEQFRLEIGDMAPDFELESLDGEMVRLSDLRGSMVVLDFWASWCGPCMKGLPYLDKFAKWADSSNLPIQVLGIDSFERFPTDDLKRARIEKVWKAKGFSFPTLLDFDSSATRSYEVGPIPHGVVIDTEGRIYKIHIGFDPRTSMFERLKQEAQEILEIEG